MLCGGGDRVGVGGGCGEVLFAGFGECVVGVVGVGWGDEVGFGEVGEEGVEDGVGDVDFEVVVEFTADEGFVDWFGVGDGVEDDAFGFAQVAWHVQVSVVRGVTYRFTVLRNSVNSLFRERVTILTE